MVKSPCYSFTEPNVQDFDINTLQGLVDLQAYLTAACDKYWDESIAPRMKECTYPEQVRAIHHQLLDQIEGPLGNGLPGTMDVVVRSMKPFTL